MIATHSQTWGRADLQRKFRGFVSQIVACLLTAITFIAIAASVHATTIFGVDSANNLVRFDSATPGTIISTAPIVGLAAGESVLGIDFRPQDGKLFALGSTSRLYSINFTSNPATAT